MNPREAAEGLAQDLARRAIMDSLGAASRTGERRYHADSGLLRCVATFDGAAATTAWTLDGLPASRASAESMIAARISRIAGLP